MAQGPGFCVPSFHFLVATHLKDVDQRVTRSNCDPLRGLKVESHQLGLYVYAHVFLRIQIAECR